MIHPLKITSTLSDETRFSIFEKILQSQQRYTVQQIADLFEIHPNVARLHLTKLTEIGVIVSELMKTGKGGRPGRVYKAASETITISFPRKEHQQLLEWTLKLIETLGSEALQKGKEISYDDGYHSMISFMKKRNTSTLEQKLSILNETASLIGYTPKFNQTDDQLTVQFTIFNCPYSSSLKEHQNIVCEFHEAYLKGQMDALFGENDLVQYERMSDTCQLCHYHIHSKN